MKYLFRLCAAVTLLFSLYSCHKENLDNSGPDAAVSDADWQVVGADAGSIAKDDLTVTFPKGTFGGGDKVAITPVKAGTVSGSDEKSAFYQVTMPAKGSEKPVTVAIRYAGDPTDVIAVVQTECFSVSREAFLKSSQRVPSQAKDGQILVTIPETRSCNGQSAWFTVGLVDSEKNDPEAHSVDTKAVDWTFDWELSRADKDKYRPYKKQINDILRNEVPHAISILQARGFDVPAMSYKLADFGKKDKTWGYQSCPVFFKTLTWTGSVSINAASILELLTSGKEDGYNVVGKTIIHETLHAAHCLNYDPRWALTETVAGFTGSQWTMLSEALAVWSEQFIDTNHLLGNDSENLPKINAPQFAQAFFPPDVWVGHNKYQNQGYAMAAFIQYLSKKTSHNSIVRLLQLQKQGIASVRAILDQFLKEKGLKFFDTANYLDFATMYLDGNLDVKDLNYSYLDVGTACKTSATVSPKYNFGNEVYSYGFVTGWFRFDRALMIDYLDEDLNITQLTEGLETHVWYDSGAGLKYVGKAVPGAPVTLPISTFVKNAKELQLVTATMKSTMTDDESYLRSSVLVSFKQKPVVPDIWTMGLEGDFTVNGVGGYWLNEGWTDGSGYSTITVTEVSNGFYVVAKDDWYDLDFTITVKDGTFSDAINIRNVRHTGNDSDKHYCFTIDKLPLTGFDSGKDSSYGRAVWKGSSDWYTNMRLEVMFYSNYGKQ